MSKIRRRGFIEIYFQLINPIHAKSSVWHVHHSQSQAFSETLRYERSFDLSFFFIESHFRNTSILTSFSCSTSYQWWWSYYYLEGELLRSFPFHQVVFSEKYHHHPTYLFSFHVCRLIFNTTIFSSSNVVDKVLKPIFEEFCGFGGKCSDVRIVPHTPVATLYVLFFVLMTLNFEICIILLYYNDPYRRPRTAMIVRVGDVENQHRRYFRLNNSSSPSDPDPHPPTGYCNSPRLAFTKAFVPFSKTQKYHRLDACVSSALRSSKYRIAPLTIPIPLKLINW